MHGARTFAKIKCQSQWWFFFSLAWFASALDMGVWSFKTREGKLKRTFAWVCICAMWMSKAYNIDGFSCLEWRKKQQAAMKKQNWYLGEKNNVIHLVGAVYIYSIQRYFIEMCMTNQIVLHLNRFRIRFINIINLAWTSINSVVLSLRMNTAACNLKGWHLAARIFLTMISLWCGLNLNRLQKEIKWARDRTRDEIGRGREKCIEDERDIENEMKRNKRVERMIEQDGKLQRKRR